MTPIKRPHYFKGQFLKADDFIAEQEYHMQMRQLHNSTMHIWGIADGLDVTADGAGVKVKTGIAIDKNGKEIQLLEEKSLPVTTSIADGSYFVIVSYKEEFDKASPYPPAKESDPEDTRYIRKIETGELSLVATAPPPAGEADLLKLARVTVSGGKVTGQPDKSMRRVASSRIPRGSSLGDNDLTISLDGKIGIGTTGPTQKLQVEGGNILVKGVGNFSTGQEAFVFLGDTSHYIKASFGSGVRIGTFGVGDAITLIQSSGRVGIGTTNPVGRLSISEASGIIAGPSQGTLIIDHENNGGASSIVFRSKVNRGGDYGYIQYQDDATIGGTAESARLIIGIENDADDHLILKPSGKVGIGTMQPKAKLEIQGGADNAGGNDPQAMAFSYSGSGGGYRHWIRTRHNATLGSGNAFDFYLNNSTTSEGSSAPTTGTLHTMTLDSGRIGIGTTNPRTALDTGRGVMSGAPNDYQKAQYTMSGGGIVSWEGPGGRLKWTKRFVAISMGKPECFSEGYLDINQPTTDIPAAQVHDGSVRSANADGIVLKDGEALYAVHLLGGSHTAVYFEIVHYTKDFYAPSNYLLVAVVNGDDRTVKLGTGVIVSAKSSSSKGNSLPCGTIVMWHGAPENIPEGWALCNGSNGTPDLRNRFIVGAGAGSEYTVDQKGGEKMVTLGIDHIPSHNHAAGDKNQLLKANTGGNVTASGLDATVTEPNVKDSSATILSVGGGQPHENRPPYYALCFIMKLFA